MSKPKVNMFTDGSCLGNPGPGGWATLLRYNKTEKMFSGAELETTNNRMELMAVIKGLQALTKACHIDLYSDSKYVIDGYSKWMPNWKAKAWSRGKGKELLNKDLWQQLDENAKQHTIKWHWVKGHSGHAENERVDQLARLEAEKIQGIHA